MFGFNFGKSPRQQLEDELKYSPMFVSYKGKMVKLTIENYEEITGKKLPQD